MPGKITTIPVEGDSGSVPTGAMQFLNDWPGLFLRGDDAICLLGELQWVQEQLREHCGRSLPYLAETVMKIIENDVRSKASGRE